MWATNHLVILSAQLNWNTSATKLAQKTKPIEEMTVHRFSDVDNTISPLEIRILECLRAELGCHRDHRGIQVPTPS